MIPTLILLSLPLYSGCSTLSKPFIPDELLVECPVPVVNKRTTGDIVRENGLLKKSLQQCNATKRAYK